MKHQYLVVPLMLVNSTFSFADIGRSPAQETPEQIRKLSDSLKWQQGTITLQNGLAKLEVPKEFRYYDHANSVKILEEWGNKDIGDTLGMLFPTDLGPFAENSWGVVITYDDSGHVKDDDAQSIDYSKLLSEMQAGTREVSKERKEQGLRQIELLGWATPPKYDADTHKMYWAKELRFEGSRANTLNYNIRILGKEGVLVLNAVAVMDQIKTIEKEAPAILAFTEFTPGNRYNDFREGVHKLAGYGLAGLVAGGIAVKTLAKIGILKAIVPFLLAMKKFIAVFFIGIFAAVRKFFGRKKTEKIPDPETTKGANT